MWFLGPIALCIAALIIYVFFIWYRDWLGKNTFAYRLLMLPTDSNEYLFSESDNDPTICFGSCSPATIIIAGRRSSDQMVGSRPSFVQTCLFMKLQN